MKKIKMLIIGLLILLVIIILVFSIIMYYNGQENNSDSKETEFEKQIDYEAQITAEKEDNRNRYYATVSIANKFLTAMLEENSETIYNMLNPEYVKEFNITKANAFEKVNCLSFENLDEYQLDNLEVKIKIKDMYRIEKSVNIRNYFVYGNIVNNINDEEIPYNLIINMDSKNNTFYILPNDYVKEYQYDSTNNIESYQVSFEEIQSNEYNNFQFVNIDDARVINDYIANYKELVVKNLKESFNWIAEDYKKAKFSTYEKYEQYIKENMKDILSMQITKYRINKTENGKEYICLDNKGNYYIFLENAIMDYKIYLDDYTVDTQEFIQKYNQETDLNKVKYNADKFLKALNKNDYEYIFGKLDETFMQNNFSTFDGFKNYMEQRFNNSYTSEYYETREENGTFIQEIELIDENGNRNSLEIIMQLKDGTDFVMSFSVN